MNWVKSLAVAVAILAMAGTAQAKDYSKITATEGA